MKIKIIGIIAIVLVLLGGTWMMKEKSFSKKWNHQIENMQAYILKGDMEIRKGQGYQNYEIEVYYQKENEQYKVVLNDPVLKQTQSIVRNKDGVYVMTPQLNQIFKFQGSWPNNTKKPYLIQTIDQILKEAEIKKENNQVIAKSEVTYEGHEQYKYQTMIFDQEARIKEVTITNEQQDVEMKLVIRECLWNPNLAKDTFEIPDSLDVKTSSIAQEQLPLYPMEVYDAKLSDIAYVDTIDGQKVMMTYEGEKSFTLVQSMVQPKETTQMVYMPGTLYEQYDFFGVEELFQFSAYYKGIEFRIYSEDLTTLEMVEVLNSVQGVGMK